MRPRLRGRGCVIDLGGVSTFVLSMIYAYIHMGTYYIKNIKKIETILHITKNIKQRKIEITQL